MEWGDAPEHPWVGFYRLTSIVGGSCAVSSVTPRSDLRREGGDSSRRQNPRRRGGILVGGRTDALHTAGFPRFDLE